MKRPIGGIEDNKILTADQRIFLQAFGNSEELIELAEKKCEIKGIRHILKGRLLQVPEGIDSLQLTSEIKKQDVEDLFRRLVKDIVEREIL